MSTKAKLYAISVAVAGLALTGVIIAAGWSFQETPHYVVLSLLTLVAALLKVKLPTIHGSISVLFVFLLIGLGTATLAYTLALGSIATLLQCVWKQKNGIKPVQVLFNIAAVNLSTMAAYYVPLLLSGRIDNFAGLVLSGCTFFGVNAGLVSLVIALVQNDRLEKILQQCYLWSFPYYLIGAAIAAAVSLSTQELGWGTSMLILPLMYLVYRYYRICLARGTTLTPARQ